MGAPEQYDVTVIGGGASGLAAALSAARAGAAVAVIERDVACGTKILVTGNGRCNLSNTHLDTSRYNNPTFAGEVMGEQPERELLTFFSSLGIITVEEEGRLYPRSLKAASARDALLRACRKEGVKLLSGHTVTDIDAPDGKTWSIDMVRPTAPLKAKAQKDRKAELRALRKALAEAPKESVRIRSRALVIATGGGTPDIPNMIGLDLVPGTPVLCPVESQVVDMPHALEELNGLRVHADVALKRDGERIWSEAGEVLFRPYGISGVVAFNLSRRIERGDTVLLDFFPEMDRDAFHRLLLERERIMGPFSPADPTWFDGMLAPALARVACGIYDFCHAGSTDVVHLVSVLKHFKLIVSGRVEETSAQVTRGGIPLEQASTPDLAITADGRPMAFACGEALDIDADCGGYNLAWAWISGIRCGTAAAHAARS